MILSFMRNKVVDVDPTQDGSLDLRWRVTDTWLEASLELKVGVPDLEIQEIQGRILRAPHPECLRALDLLPKVLGVRVGPGLRKIVDGLLGGATGCPELAEGVLEACNGVILHFTVPQLKATERGSEGERKERFQEMLRFNPRLVGSCVAFAQDSPLMEGLL